MKEEIKIEHGEFRIGRVTIGTPSIFFPEEKIDFTIYTQNTRTAYGVCLGVLWGRCGDCGISLWDTYAVVGNKIVRYRTETPCSHLVDAIKFIYDSSH